MNEHKIINNKPDWEHIPKEDWNNWQKIASATNSLITPGNIVSGTSFGLLKYGLKQVEQGNQWRGLSIIIGSKVGDLIDGFVADKTGTKSPIGAVVDQTTDKLSLLTTFPTIKKMELVPNSVLYPIMAQNSLNVYIAAKSQLGKVKMKGSSKEGKITQVSQWSTMGLFALSKMTEGNHNDFSKKIGYIAKLSLLPMTYFSYKATKGYFRELATNKNLIKVN